MENKTIKISCGDNKLTITPSSRIVIQIGESGIIFASGSFLCEAINMYNKEVEFNTSQTIVEYDPTLP